MHSLLLGTLEERKKTTTKVIIGVLLQDDSRPAVCLFFLFSCTRNVITSVLISFMLCAIAHRAKWDILNISMPFFGHLMFIFRHYVLCCIFFLFLSFCRNHKCSAFCWCSGFVRFGNTFLFSRCYLTLCSLYLLWLLTSLSSHSLFYSRFIFLILSCVETWESLSSEVRGGCLCWLAKASSVKFTFSLRLAHWSEGAYFTAAQQRNPVQAPVLTTWQNPLERGNAFVLKSFMRTWNLALGLATVSKGKAFLKKFASTSFGQVAVWTHKRVSGGCFFHIVLFSPDVASLDSIFISSPGDDKGADEYLCDDTAALAVGNTRETEYFLTSP